MRKIFSLLCIIALLASVSPSYGQYITTAAGGGHSYPGDSGLATGAQLYYPEGVAIGPRGDLYIADTDHNRVRHVVASTGIITTVAGTGTGGFAGDSAPATAARVSSPSAVAVDASGHLYIADYGNQRIRRVDAVTGIITTIAGIDSGGYNGDNIPAIHAALKFPNGLAIDSAGDLYIGDSGNQRVRRIDAISGMITTVAGGGTTNPGDSGQATAAELFEPQGLAIGPGGTLYIADGITNRVRRVDPVSHIITTVAGCISSTYCSQAAGYSGDGGLAIYAQLSDPWGLLLIDTTLYIADAHNNRIRAVGLPSGFISTYAGNGDPGQAGDTLLGDGGFSYNATVWNPTSLAVDSLGNIYIADYGDDRVRMVSSYYTGIANIAAPGALSVYPNPSQGQFTIEAPDMEGNEHIEVYNVVGEKIYQSALNNGQSTINLSGQPTGMYFISVRSAASVQTTRVMITN